MDTIKHTQITEKSIKLSTPGADIETRIVKVSSEIINVADAELRKVEAVAAAQAEAIAGIEEAEQESAESADRAEFGESNKTAESAETAEFAESTDAEPADAESTGSDAESRRGPVSGL